MIYDIFYVSKQEVNASSWKQFRQRFPSAQKIDNVNSLEDVKRKSFTKFFWVVWDDLIVLDTFMFDYRVEKWDESYIHSFLNAEFRDGICLFPKSAAVTQKEFIHRFYFNKKEIDIVASKPRPYDIIFISYNELNADENYERLKLKWPEAKRIHGVKGIHQAHIAAANLSETEMFWVVDGDAVISPDFNFTVKYYPHYDSGNRREHINTVHVWHSKNPINGLVYGNGGVKLLPKLLTMNIDTTSVDMTLAISDRFKLMSSVSNYNMFNTNEFTTWRSAFRECVKLSTKVIDEKYDTETDNRLNTWCTKGAEKPFGKYAIAGANAGVEFGLRFVGLDEILSKINDFAWLEEEFKKWKLTNE